MSEIGNRVGTIIGTTLGSYEVGVSGIQSWRESGHKRANPMSIVNAPAQHARTLRQQADECRGSADYAFCRLRHRYTGGR